MKQKFFIFIKAGKFSSFQLRAVSLSAMTFSSVENSVHCHNEWIWTQIPFLSDCKFILPSCHDPKLLIPGEAFDGGV